MNKEFVPYNEALALKELGFDEECFKCKVIGQEHLDYTPTDYDDFPEQKEKEVLIPTYSQVFRWFREKYSLYHDIKMFGDWDKPQFSYIVSGRTMTNPAHMWHYEDKNSYEEAELACLKKLIEIKLKNK